MADDVFGIVGSLQAAVFRVERVVAEGGFGVVYRAYHEGFRAPVAIKCLKIPGAFSAEQRQAFFQRFQEEGELLFRLSALIPAVVRPLHVGTLETARHPFVPFIALEWLDGESLDALVARRRESGKAPLELSRVVRLLAPVARALECAHRFPAPDGSVLSILHRDLKPENLFLAKLHGHETLRILDFGIGKVRSAATQMVGRASVEQAGSIAAFTPAYGAPEQWLPKRYGQTGPWTDVWGFALCAVEALTGAAPFDGDAPAVMCACIDELRRPTPRQLGAQVPDRVEAAFLKALAVDPVQRFQDIGAFWDEVEAAVGISTPRIELKRSVAHDSLVPAPMAASSAGASSLLTEVAATARAAPGNAHEIPDLSPLVPEPRPRPPQQASPGPAASGRAGAGPASRRARDDDASGLELSVMRSDSVEQLAAIAEASPPTARRAVALDAGRAQRVARNMPARGLPSEVPSMNSVFLRLLPALRLIGLGVVVMGADYAYALLNGAAFSLGPVRAFWIAAPLVAFGLIKLALLLVNG